MLKLLAVSLLLNVGLSQAQLGEGYGNNFDGKHLAKLPSYPPKKNQVIPIMTNIAKTYGYRRTNTIFYSKDFDVKEKLVQKVNASKCGNSTIPIKSSDFAQGVVWSNFPDKAQNDIKFIPLDCWYAEECVANITVGCSKKNRTLAIVHLDKVYNCTNIKTCENDEAGALNAVTPEPWFDWIYQRLPNIPNICPMFRGKRAPCSGDTSETVACTCVDVRPVNRSVCNFEKDFCDWRRAPGSTFNFKRVKGPTDMAGKTGPTADRHGSLTGYYIYADASDNMGQIATLRSPNFTAGNYCVEFYYHMFGVNFEGSLQLMMYTSKTAPQSVSTKTSSIGNKWNLFLANLDANALGKENFYFELKARIGKSYTSDIAIDDISITKGRCLK